MESYTALAVAERGLPAGMTALEILGLLAQRRAPVRYSPSGAARFGRHGAATAEAWRIEGFLPRAVLTEVHKCAAALVAAELAPLLVLGRRDRLAEHNRPRRGAVHPQGGANKRNALAALQATLPDGGSDTITTGEVPRVDVHMDDC